MISLGDRSHLNDIERSQPARRLRVVTINIRACQVFYTPVILERRDSVMPALIGEQRGRDNEQSLGYVKNRRLHTSLSIAHDVLFSNILLN